jgi:exodeoxyribonuclease V alpha subunit
MPAYAITVHKSQGSGFPYVIVPVHNSFYAELFCRELFYTAISRAEKLLITVGQWSAIVAAIGRKTVHKRRTTLVRRLRAAAASAEAAANLEAILESNAEIRAMTNDDEQDELEDIFRTALAS